MNNNKISYHPIIFLTYFPRISGHFFAFTCALSALGTVNRNSSMAYFLLFLGAFIWPHIALLCSIRSKDPRPLEFYFLLIDAFILGGWCAYFGFQLLPATVFITGTSITCFSINGLGLGLKAMLANVLGALLVVALFGFLYHPFSNATTVIYSVLFLLTFTNVIGYLTYYRAKLSKKNRAQLREVMEEFDDINKILQRSSASLDLSTIMRILEEFLKNKVLSFDALGLQILTPKTQELKFKLLINETLSQEELTQLSKIVVNSSEKSIENEVLLYKEPKYLLDVNNYQLSDYNKVIQKNHDVHSMAIYPLIIKNESVGLITFYSKTPLIASDRQMKKITSYINYVALTINNTLLYADLQKKREEIFEKNTQLDVVSTQLAKYIPPQLFTKITQGKVSTQISAHKSFLTVFFSDLIGFTALSDLLPSKTLTSILNSYLDSMTNIALKHGGTIDKYMGDRIMVFFGDSENANPAEDAKKCSLMALEMRKTLEDSGLKWHELGVDIPLKMRMGIHSGVCSIGNFGSNFRMNYTAMGSIVNLTSRLEHIAKANEIIISEETYSLIKEAFSCNKQGKVMVKGIDKPITIYQIVDVNEN